MRPAATRNAGLRSELDDVAVRVFDVRERLPRTVLAATDELAARALDLGDRRVDVRVVIQAKPEVADARVDPRDARLLGILVQRDQVPAARRVEEDHRRAVAEELTHPEHLLVEPKDRKSVV